MNRAETLRRLIWLVVLAVAGCSGKGDLSGKVTFKDQPLRMGTVSVAGGDGVICSGVLQDDGAYTVSGIATGTVKIAVSSVNPSQQKSGAKPQAGLVAAPTGDPAKWIAIPEQYADFERSGLTFPLQGGQNSLHIELK